MSTLKQETGELKRSLKISVFDLIKTTIGDYNNHKKGDSWLKNDRIKKIHRISRNKNQLLKLHQMVIFWLSVMVEELRITMMKSESKETNK